MRYQATVQEPIATGTYRAEIQEITQSKGDFGPQLKWVFVISQEGEAFAKKLNGYTAENTNVQSNMMKWAGAALQQMPDEDFEFDTDELVGREVRLVVIEQTRKDNTIGNKITEVLPVKKGRQSVDLKKPSPVPAEEDEPDPFDE